jgi:hypothetical protein
MTLENFIQINHDIPCVLVQGLGFVGSVMSLVVDQDTEVGRKTTVDTLNAGVWSNGASTKGVDAVY